MNVGILKELKAQENRVSMTPSGVESMVSHGHTVFVERGAGEKSGFDDNVYAAAGANLMPDADAIYTAADMLMHVKEPMPEEYGKIRPGQLIFTYFHLAPDPTLTQAMLSSGAVCVAYETVQRANGSLPLLTPMSEVAGRLSVQEGARFLTAPAGGSGVLLGGVTGVEPATVMILGGGTVGSNAALLACGLGAKVYVLDKNLDRLRWLDETMPANCFPLFSSSENIRSLLPATDMVVGSVLIPGGKTPHLITRDMLGLMKPGSVLVDVAIDQGGCFETSRPTTFADPVFVEQGILHYCVGNIPGAVPRTSSLALTNATLPYALDLADKGWVQAVKDSAELRAGLNIAKGKVTNMAVAMALNLPFVDPETLA